MIVHHGFLKMRGEMSGHIFFKERWFGFDDGNSAGCRMLEILSSHVDASAVLEAPAHVVASTHGLGSNPGSRQAAYV